MACAHDTANYQDTKLLSQMIACIGNSMPCEQPKITHKPIFTSSLCSFMQCFSIDRSDLPELSLTCKRTGFVTSINSEACDSRSSPPIQFRTLTCAQSLYTSSLTMSQGWVAVAGKRTGPCCPGLVENARLDVEVVVRNLAF